MTKDGVAKASVAENGLETNAHGQAIGTPIAGWTARSAPPRSGIAGRYCRLEPLGVERHAQGLFTAYHEAPDGRDWTYLPIERPADRESYIAHVAAQAVSRDPLHHAIVAPDGTPLGTAALMRIDKANGVIEVGHIAYAPCLQRTPAATEAIYLLAKRVFDELGYRRFEWKCDSLNAPSRRAALRYGFTFEGIFRQAVVTKGRNRDTAWYAMTDADWPARRDAFEAWLAPTNFSADGMQKRPLSAFRSLTDGGV